MASVPQDTPELRKQRGAFFTPYEIAEFLTSWAVGGNRGARILDPSSGEGVFLLAAARRLRALGVSSEDLARQLHGVDIHQGSLEQTRRLLTAELAKAELIHGDFFAQAHPGQLGADLPWMDAVVGNPPFVRYQEHRGDTRKRALAAALSQGVRLSGLASSWAALLIHASSFLKPDGRIAMVLPAELLAVGYAEPVRRWLTERFSAVHLVLFDHLQFEGAEEQVVLLVARGSGGCSALALHQVRDARDLRDSHLFDSEPVAFGRPEDKWTDLLLPLEGRSRFQGLVQRSFARLDSYGAVELGTVTGANAFFAVSEPQRARFKISPSHFRRLVPPGARHVPGTRFTEGHWQQLKAAGQRVWLLHPAVSAPRGGLAEYIAQGQLQGIHDAYKCAIRDPWWRPPAVEPPDLFFTYMSHVCPRLVTNDAGATIVNSLHGLMLHDDSPSLAREALPLALFNSATMLGAELQGRPYGGGILKMEPREAAGLPVPTPEVLAEAWTLIAPRRAALDEMIRSGAWMSAVTEIDRALLIDTVGLSPRDVRALRADAARFRARRMHRVEA